jgi:deoxyribose-phosphate aldolase
MSISGGGEDVISKFDYASIARTIDYALVNPTLTDSDLETGCELGVRYGVACVSLLPFYIVRCVQILTGTGVRAGTTIGFPHGCQTICAKLAELGEALRSGTEELDAVVNISKVRSGDWFYVENELRRLTDAAHAGGVKIKIIFENAYLNDCEKIRLCEICGDIGADWVKTSTGFAPTGARMSDLILMRNHSQPHVRLKAAGGIRDLDTVLALRGIGVDRVGTSHTQAILDECRRRLGLEPIEASTLVIAGADY